jgi:hypothetical protein
LTEKTKGPFSLSVFKPLYSGQSSNNVGFLGAAMKYEGLLVSDKRQYLRKDPKAFMTKITKLTAKKPSKKRPKKIVK